jgi:serine/threonine-protein kinase
MVKGKAGYLSPEQARAQPLDRRSDVWAAGVVAWEVLSGRRLFDHDDPVAIALAIVTERAPRIRSVLPDVPAEADDAIASALMRDRERRLGTAAELGRRLAAAWGMGLASRAEVAACVARLAGDRIAARRARAQEVLEQRRSATASSWVADAPATIAAGATTGDEAKTTTREEGARAATSRGRLVRRGITLGLGALLAGGLLLATLGRDHLEPNAAEAARGAELEAPTARGAAASAASAPVVASASAAVSTASNTADAPPPRPRTPTRRRALPPPSTSATPLGPNPYEAP